MVKMTLRYACWMAMVIANLATVSQALPSDCMTSGSTTSKLFCYYSDAKRVDVCKCSHIILPESTPLDQLQGLTEEKSAKVLLTVRDFNKNLLEVLNSTKLFGLEIQLKKLDAKNDISDFISTIRTKLGSSLFISLSVPSKPEVLAKYYDFKSLSKDVDLFMLQTDFLGANYNVTFHPSRLSGLWDVQNTDSVVDLVTGLGAPLGKLVITSPVQAFKFLLQNDSHTAPGSPAVQLSTLGRNELCMAMDGNSWISERDQDQAGPYIFRDNKWIAFEDATSIDIKAKYARVRGLAGLALKDVSQDGGAKCGETLLDAAFNGLRKQGRAPRAAVLQSLEREILQTAAGPFDHIQVSPYRISRLIDTEGKVHVIRKDTRTEFPCARQGYFVHPRSCNRFYRCVKFDQQSDEFSVFEFDCPVGLAFDERVEVCVWPGTLPHSSACAGSSEIAPVPLERFTCRNEQGYFADPENCRWFFACVDHGKSSLLAYEFRCPYGLVFDENRLMCEWSWLVPKCGPGVGVDQEYAFGSDGSNSVQNRGGVLDLYDGLGSLPTIRLGGLSSPLKPTETSSNYNRYTGDGYDYGSDMPANSQYNDDSDTHRAFNINFNVPSRGLTDGSLPIVNVVSSGTSRVGTYSAKNVDLLQHGKNIGVESRTPATLVPSTTISPESNVPTVAIPSSYRDQANLANLQYKQENPMIINHQLHPIANQLGHYDNSNITIDQSINVGIGSNNYATARTPFGAGFGSYDVTSYSRPQKMMAESFNVGNHHYGVKPLQSEDMKSYSKYDTFNKQHYEEPKAIEVNPGGYFYNKPKVLFNEFPRVNETIPPVRTYQQVALESIVPYNQVKTETIGQTFNNQGYRYEKPSIKLEERPQNIGHEQGYFYDKPTIKFEEKPISTTNVYHDINIQPAVAVKEIHQQVYNFGNPTNDHEPKSIGYIYNKPDLKLVDKPIRKDHTYQEVKAKQEEPNGYVYERPSIKFEETPTVPSTTYQEINIKSAGVIVPVGYHYDTPHIKFEEKPIISSIQTQKEVHTGGYKYEKPAIKFEEEPVINYQQIKVQPALTMNHEVKQEGYIYKQPALKFEETPNIPVNVPTKTYQEIKFQPAIHKELTHDGYHYKKPTITFEEKPIIPSTTYQEIHLQHTGYNYEKPSVKFEDKTFIPVSTYQESKKEPITEIKPETKLGHYQYVKPTITFEEKIPATKYQEIHIQTALPYPQENNNNYAKPSITIEEKPIVTLPQEVKHGYHYTKPAAKFEENPIPQQTYLPSEKRTYLPPIAKPSGNYLPQKSTVHSYSYKNRANTQHSPIQPHYEVQHVGYQYEKPAFHFEEKPIEPVTAPTPQGYRYEKPTVRFEEKPNTALVFPVKPLATSQVLIQPTAAIHTQEGYIYNKPKVIFEEIAHIPTITYQQTQPQVQFNQAIPDHHARYYNEKPKVQFGEKVVTPATTYIHHYANTPSTPIFNTYQEVKPLFSEPKPTYKQTVQLVTPKPTIVSSFSINQYNGCYRYDKPIAPFEEQPTQVYLPTKPTNTTTKPNPALNYIPPRPALQYIPAKPTKTYIYATTPATSTIPPKSYIVPPPVQPTKLYVKPKPQVVYQDFSKEKEIVEKPLIRTTAYQTGYNYAIPSRKFIDGTSPRPTFQGVANIVTKIEPAPLKYYSYDHRLYHPRDQPVAIASTTAKPKYEISTLPEKITQTSFIINIPDREYLPQSTKRPIITTTQRIVLKPSTQRQYLPPSTPRAMTSTQRNVQITSPSKDYESVTQEIYKIRTSTPAQEYLPVSKRVRTRPTSTTTSTTTTTLKPNREYLPAKEIEHYEYQASVAPSSSRRPKVIKVVRARPIVKLNDFHPTLSAKLGAQCTCVSNTLSLRRQKPEKAASNQDETTREEYVLPIDDQQDLRYGSTPKKQSVIIVAEEEDEYINQDDEARRQDIAKAVNNGLKLVKSAVRQGVKEGVRDAFASKDFDRYGPGGVRGRSETLQGTTDCQRAGLFRHPNHCSKFYACRWDDRKKKFTLHVFNCPVHLTFDNNLGACNWPSQGPTCVDNTLLPNE